MEKTVQKAKKEIAELKAKLNSAKAIGLCWEARRLLQLYAQGYHDWCGPERRKTWLETYEKALKQYTAELAHPEKVSEQTLYWLGFMAWFRGQPDEEKQWESELEFWLLARTIAPKPTEHLLLHVGSEHLYKPEDLKARREFLAEIDKVNVSTITEAATSRKEQEHQEPSATQELTR
jgi:hypothetical protein